MFPLYFLSFKFESCRHVHETVVSTWLPRAVSCFLTSTLPTANILNTPSIAFHVKMLWSSRTSQAPCVPYAIILILAARETSRDRACIRIDTILRTRTPDLHSL